VSGPDERLARGAADILGRALTHPERQHLVKYLELLGKWQKTQRLIGSSDPSWIVDNVILDSLLFSRVLPEGVRRVVDVGSGAGLPGIPLKIVRAALTVTLVEARQKRASFLSAAVRELALADCRVINARLETLGEKLSGRFDAAVARCAGDPQRLAADLQPILGAGGIIVASGPPEPRPLQVGEWAEVHWSGRRRLFWVYRIS
jgi:16S rRNA (guanine527-N7)-methyltransferase